MEDAAPPMPPELFGSWVGVGAAPPTPPRHAAGVPGGAVAGGAAATTAAAWLPPAAAGKPWNEASSFSDYVNVEALFEA